MIREASKTFAGFMSELEGEAVLVEVYTPLCRPCQVLKKDVLPEVQDRIEILTVDATKNTEALNVIQNAIGSISSVPVLILYKNGGVAKVNHGAMTLDDVEKFIS